MSKKKSTAWLIYLVGLNAAIFGCNDEKDINEASAPTADVVEFVISDAAQKEALADVVYNPGADEFLAFWQSEPASLEGDQTNRILGRRISSAGEPIGEAFVVSEGAEKKVMAKAAFNTVSQTVLVIFSQQATKLNVFAAVLDAQGQAIRAPAQISNGTADQVHINLAFNSTREQFLVTYNDSRNGEGNGDVFAVILDKNGEVAVDEFAVCTAAGNQFNPWVTYDPAADNYLMNWEDFRDEAAWTDPGNIIGALVSGDGEVLVNDIPMMQDTNGELEGDQRFNGIAYSEASGKYLVSWGDTRSDRQNASVGGRFVNAAGAVEGEPFALIDFAGAQMIAHPISIPDTQGYLVAYENDDADLDAHYFMDTSAALDVMAVWVDSGGANIGDPIRVAVGEANQRFAKAAYSPAAHAALIVWQEDVGKVTDPIGHMTATGGNIMGAMLPPPTDEN